MAVRLGQYAHHIQKAASTSRARRCASRVSLTPEVWLRRTASAVCGWRSGERAGLRFRFTDGIILWSAWVIDERTGPARLPRERLS